VSPLRGEKPQNWPLSKLNTGRFALRAMLPVITAAAVAGGRSWGSEPSASTCRTCGNHADPATVRW